MKIRYLLFSLLFITWSCKVSDPAPISDNEYLISLQKVDEIGRWQANLAADLLDFPEFKPLITSDVDVYRIVYKSSYNETLIVASGLIAIPRNNDQPMAVVSVQHGTLVAHADAPSEVPGDYLILSALATTGMITLIPDFAGFGSSTEVLHPYFVEEGEAVPVVDMIKATMEMMEDSTWTWNNNLFLTGYSEGGYVTMASHKYIQENPETGLNVTASASGSGGYDQVHMKDYFFGLSVYDQPFYLPYAIYASQLYEQADDPLNIYFQSPYAEKIPSLFDGTNGSEFINGQLTKEVRELIQPDLIENAETNSIYQPFLSRLKENSLTDWSPSAPMRLYHGTADLIVPFENSVATVAKLDENGASDQVTFMTIEDGTHTSSFIPMFKDVVVWFSELN